MRGSTVRGRPTVRRPRAWSVSGSHIGELWGKKVPVAVALQMPKAGSLKGCTEADAPVIIAIMKKPAGYYVNVHNAAFPKGAVRPTLDRLNRGHHMAPTHGDIGAGDIAGEVRG
jgi:hypothetical protein